MVVLWRKGRKAESYRRGLRSMQTFSKMSLRNWGALSCTTCWIRSRDFRYSKKRFMKPTKCSAVRILPGTASAERKGGIIIITIISSSSSSGSIQFPVLLCYLPCRISSGKTGLDRYTSVSRATLASFSPSTNRLYSSFSLAASVSFILRSRKEMMKGSFGKISTERWRN